MNLKLEKDLKTKRIFLSVKPKTYSKDLILAFFIALSLHLTAFTLFQIDLGTFFSLETSPAVTFVSTQNGRLAIFADEKQEVEVPSYLQIERKSSPQGLFTFQQEIKLPPFQPDLSGLSLEDPKALCKSSWHFSKGIFHAEGLPELTCDGMRKAAFAFRLAGSSIFWLQMLQSTGNLKLDRELEESLKKVHLTSLAKEGIVEVEFLP